MISDYIRGTFIIAPSLNGPAHVIVVVEDDTAHYAAISSRTSDGDSGAIAVEIRALPMGLSRSDPGGFLEIAALLTDLCVGVTAAAIWDGIVSSIMAVVAARRRSGDATAANLYPAMPSKVIPASPLTSRIRLTVTIPTGSGDHVLEVEAAGPDSLDSGFAAFERVVCQVLAASTPTES